MEPVAHKQIQYIVFYWKIAEFAVSVEGSDCSCGFYCDVETRNLTVNKAVREAQVAQYNYFLCVGGQEVENGTVTVRIRDQAKNQRPQCR